MILPDMESVLQNRVKVINVSKIVAGSEVFGTSKSVNCIVFGYVIGAVCPRFSPCFLGTIGCLNNAKNRTFWVHFACPSKMKKKKSLVLYMKKQLTNKLAIFLTTKRNYNVVVAAVHILLSHL